MGRRQIVTTEEQDVHTGWRRVMCTFSRAGQSGKAKRRSRRRERVVLKRELIAELADLGLGRGEGGDAPGPYTD